MFLILLFSVFHAAHSLTACTDYNRNMSAIIKPPVGYYNATFILDGVLPSLDNNKWDCSYNGSETDAIGFFVYYYNGGESFTFSVQPSAPTNETWQFLFHRKRGGDGGEHAQFMLCKWQNFPTIDSIPYNQDLDMTSAYECFLNHSIPWTYRDQAHAAYGLTWFDDYVRVFAYGFFMEFSMDGLMWSRVSWRSRKAESGQVNVQKQVSRWLTHSNEAGVLDRYIDCDASFTTSIMCRELTFELLPGVYSNNEIEYPSVIYTVTNNLTQCPPLPFSSTVGGYGRNCGWEDSCFDLYDQSTNSYTRRCCAAEYALYSNCYLNYFDTFVQFLNGPDARVVNSHLVLPDGSITPFTHCNGVNRFTVGTTCVPAFRLRVTTRELTLEPGKNVYGRPGNYFITPPTLQYGECFGWAIKRNSTFSTWVATFIVDDGAFVCPKQPETPPLGGCYSYTVHTTTFQGVLTPSNFSFSNLYDLFYFGDMLKYVRILGQVYEVGPCYEASYDVLYHDDSSYGLLYRSMACNNVRSTYAITGTGTPTALGCLYDAQFEPDEIDYKCDQPLGGGYCAELGSAIAVRSLGIVKHDTTYNAPILTNKYISLPLTHQLILTDQFVQTSVPKFDVNCETYICDNSFECRSLLKKYGGFCDKVHQDIYGSGIQLDSDVLNLYRTIAATSDGGNNFDTGVFNVTQNFVPPSGESRSFIEDLLFDKIETSGPSFYADYYECKKNAVQDLTCAQYYNGIMVIPPIMDGSTIGMYGGIAAGAVSLGLFGGQAAITTWNTAIAGRLNALGVVQNALIEDVNKLANAFNELTTAVSDIALTTSNALRAIQTVVNQNAAQVESLVKGISDNFGAISSNFKVISDRLDKLEAEVQMDRLINGRMNALQLFVTNYKLKIAELRNTHRYVDSLINECVYAQSLRNGFCGQGLHLFSFMQNAPDGIVFFHYSLIPKDNVVVQVTPGLCASTASDATCIVPKDGLFVSANNTDWQWTPRNIYKPVPLTNENVIVTTRGGNFSISNKVDDIPDISFNTSFDEDFRALYENMSQQLEQLKNLTFDPLYLNLTEYANRLDELAYNVSQMQVNVTDFQKFVQYVKWPWYVWLIIFVVFISLLFLLLWCCLATGCCGCCGLLNSSCNGCCTKPEPVDFEKVHVS